MREVVVASARRTAVGKALKGTLRHTRPDDLAAAVVKELVASHPDLDPARIGDVIMGCAMPEAEQGMNDDNSEPFQVLENRLIILQ